jgi:hypothetical protein
MNSSNRVATIGPQWLSALATRRHTKAAEQANSLTLTGVWLLLIGLLIGLSGLRSFRPSIGGLLLQPYLIPIGLAFPFVLLLRSGKFPVGPLISAIVFAAMYALASFRGATAVMDPLSEDIKVVAAIVAVFTVALLVRSRADFIFGAIGLCASVAALALRGLEDENVGERLIDVANKNSYSIYALPAVLLAGYIVLRFDWKRVAFKRWVWLPMLACAGLAAYAILTGSNRSGYLGLAFIVLELFVYTLLNRRFKIVGRATAWILVTAATGAVIGVLVWRQATEAFERRLEQTTEGTQSDRLRMDILTTSVQIGLENPVAGVSPQQLSTEIGQRLYSKYHDPAIDPHNVFAHLIGGTGIPCSLALLATAAALWFWRPKLRPGMQLGAPFFDARNFLRMTMLLWSLRGLFTREILYNPGFCIAIGLAIGLCIVEAEASVEPIDAPNGSPNRMTRPMLQRT